MPITGNLEGLLDSLVMQPQAGQERPGLLALDVSKRAIGVAGADASWRLASPITTIRRKGWAKDVQALRRIVQERGAEALVIGWPLNMDGSEGPRCQAVRQFAEDLDRALGLPMLLFDERLSTFAAKEAAERTGLRGRRREGMLDALAAAAVLQDVLNALGRHEGRAGAALR
ncbi:MAG: Holliday junction resolvase RuvX [Geminicoccales bacterium]